MERIVEIGCRGIHLVSAYTTNIRKNLTGRQSAINLWRMMNIKGDVLHPHSLRELSTPGGLVW